MSSKQGAGIGVPAPLAVDEMRRHLRFMHAVYTEPSLTMDEENGLADCHRACHAEPDARWHSDIPHHHTKPEPAPQPVRRPARRGPTTEQHGWW